MRIVNNYGELIRMSERNYKRFLQDGAAHPHTIVPADYGKMIGVIDFTCTDATKADYEMQQRLTDPR